MATQKRYYFRLRFILVCVMAIFITSLSFQLSVWPPQYFSSETENLIVKSCLAIISICCGIYLYWLRENRRVEYGALEIAFSFAIIIFLFFVSNKANDLISLSMEPTNMEAAVPSIAAIYFLVRGLDNLGVGLAKSERWGKYWKATFTIPTEDQK